jgi:hypothetical protein
VASPDGRKLRRRGLATDVLDSGDDMARKILSGLFWLASLAILVHSLRRGGTALLIPGAVGLVLALFVLDAARHRELVALDRDFVKTVLHLLSGVTVAAASLYWLVRGLGLR